MKILPKTYISNYKARINYTWQHKKAFLQVEKELKEKNTLDGDILTILTNL